MRTASIPLALAGGSFTASSHPPLILEAQRSQDDMVGQRVPRRLTVVMLVLALAKPAVPGDASGRPGRLHLHDIAEVSAPYVDFSIRSSPAMGACSSPDTL